MLTQQVARYLLKTARELKEKKGHVKASASNPTIEYLKGIISIWEYPDFLAYLQDPDAKCRVNRVGDLRNNDLILKCFGHRAAYMVMRALHLRDVEHSSWNSLLVEFYRMSVGRLLLTAYLH
jgi:acyl-CoA oxidase